MRNVIVASLKLRLVLIAVTAALMVVGVLQIRRMPVDVLPEFSPPYVEIQTESLGLSAEEVEQLITVPMEQDLLNGVPWLQTIRSESLPGLSSIVLIFEPGTDLIRARQMVSERMTQAVALPHVSKPPTMLQPLSSSSRVMVVGLSSQDMSLIQMSVLARWTIAPRLMGVPGVANVSIWGQRDRQLQVQVDPKRLADRHVSLVQVLETTANALWVSSLSFVEASTPGTGGFIDTSNQRLGIRHILPIVSPDGLARVPIEDTSLRLSDVADVVEDHQPLIGDALTGGGPSLLLVIEKFPNASTIEVTDGVEQALNDMRPGLASMQTDTSVFRPADFVETTIRNQALALLIGLLLALLAVGTFLRSWRAALITTLAVSASLIAAGLVLSLRNATLNTMIVTGFVIAAFVLISDVVTDVERVIRRMSEQGDNADQEGMAAIVVAAASETRGPAFYGMLMLVLVIIPVFFIGGASGVFMQQTALSYGLALLASTLVGIMITPALCLVLLKPSQPPASRLQTRYEATLGRIVRQPRLMLAIVALVAVAGLVTLPLLGNAYLPAFKERTLLVHLNGAPGMSQPEMSRIASRVSRELGAIAGVQSVGAQIGRAIQSDRVVNVSSSELWVRIDPAVDYDSTRAGIQNVLDGYPGIHHRLETYLSEQSGTIAVADSHDITVRVYGDTTGELRTQAANIQKAIGDIAGISGTHITQITEQPTFQIEVNIDAAQQHGIKPGDVRRAAATMFSGLQVGNLFEEQKVFDVVVWSTPSTRESLDSIRALLIDTPEGNRVRLGDVADVRIVPAPGVIRHDAVRRYVDVVASVQGRSLNQVAAEIDGRIKQMQFPLEYHAEVQGGFADQQVSRLRLIAMAVSVILAMFFLLQAAYGSWRLALLTCLTLPAGLAGGLLASLLTGGVLSFAVLGGLLAILGLALYGQLQLLGAYRALLRNRGAASRVDLAIDGARQRLTPTLTVAVAAALFLLPALVMGDVPGLELVRPLAIVFLGGLITTTLLNVFALPALFLASGVERIDELDLTPALAISDAPALGGS